MALLVESGEGLPDAESYVSIADATKYHDRIGNAKWAMAQEVDQERALRRATQYVDSRYRYGGRKLNPDQALEWPRSGRPWPIKRVTDATCELALRALEGPLFTDQQDSGQITEETIGPMTTKYADQVNGGQTRFAIVDDLLGPLLLGAAGTYGQAPMLRG